MQVRVAPRLVDAPWNAPQRSVVRREGWVQPDAGPLREYLAVFPWRYVRWEPKRQLWEIRQLNPVTGTDERIELVFQWDRQTPSTARR